LPAFPAETAAVRGSDWRVAPPAGGDVEPIVLQDLEGYADVRAWVRDFRRSNPAAEPGSVVVEVVVDTVWAILEVDEILYELREFVVRLRASPFGYLSSLIRVLSDRPEYVMPDRRDIGSATPCIDAYYRHLLATGSRRGAALEDVPERSGRLFDDDRPIEPEDLLQVPKGRITATGIRSNIETALRFLSGDARVARVDAEFARAQLWQWVHHDTGVLDTGRIIDAGFVSERLADVQAELTRAAESGGLLPGRVSSAAARLRALTIAEPIPAAIDAEGYPADV
jgi:malate synthase